MSIVLCKLPSTGLGNKLFPLMHAYVFGALNDIPVNVTGCNQFKIGPYLRGEKSKRNYARYFTFQKSIISELFDKWNYHHKLADPQYEPPVQALDNDERKLNRDYVFTEMPHWGNVFMLLKPYRELTIKLFRSLLLPEILEDAESKEQPCIGVHIRMGDFRKLAVGEDFSKVGAVRTPENYFVEVIKGIRAIHGSDLPVSIFTDGYIQEFTEIPNLKNIKIVEGNRDIVDLLLLSKSRIIVASAGSTFSYWAGFLSNAPLILHGDHIHSSIRPDYSASQLYEGPFDPQNDLLRTTIKNLT